MNLLLAISTDQLVVPAIFAVALVILIVLYISKNKKMLDHTKSVLHSVKVGVKVMTYAGIYGTVVEVYDNGDQVDVLLETGDETRKSYMRVDMNSIYSVDEATFSVASEGTDDLKAYAQEKVAESEEETK